MTEKIKKFWKENLETTAHNLREPYSDEESIEILSFFTIPKTYDDVLADKSVSKITFIQNKIDYLVNESEYIISIPVEYSNRKFYFYMLAGRLACEHAINYLSKDKNKFDYPREIAKELIVKLKMILDYYPDLDDLNKKFEERKLTITQEKLLALLTRRPVDSKRIKKMEEEDKKIKAHYEKNWLVEIEDETPQKTRLTAEDRYILIGEENESFKLNVKLDNNNIITMRAQYNSNDITDVINKINKYTKRIYIDLNHFKELFHKSMDEQIHVSEKNYRDSLYLFTRDGGIIYKFLEKNPRLSIVFYYRQDLINDDVMYDVINDIKEKRSTISSYFNGNFNKKSTIKCRILFTDGKNEF
ncbi:hypothetical protein ACFL20_09160 [Spirochaetota bacterium]